MRWHRLSSKKHLLPNQHYRLVVCWPRSITLQPLADWNLGQADILHHRPDNRQATGFRREGVNRVRAPPHIAKQTFNGVGTANVAVHHLGEGIKGQEMLFIFREAAHRFRIAQTVFGECSRPG